MITKEKSLFIKNIIIAMCILVITSCAHFPQQSTDFRTLLETGIKAGSGITLVTLSACNAGRMYELPGAWGKPNRMAESKEHGWLKETIWSGTTSLDVKPTQSIFVETEYFENKYIPDGMRACWLIEKPVDLKDVLFLNDNIKKVSIPHCEVNNPERASVVLYQHERMLGGTYALCRSPEKDPAERLQPSLLPVLPSLQPLPDDPLLQ